MSWIHKLRGLPIGEVLTFDHQIISKTIGTTPVRLITADPYRVTLTIMQSTTNVAYLGFDPTVSATNGLGLNQLADEITFSDETHPGLAGREFWVVGSAAGTVVSCITCRLLG